MPPPHFPGFEARREPRRHPLTRSHVDNFHSQMLSANSEGLSRSDAYLFSAASVETGVIV